MHSESHSELGVTGPEHHLSGSCGRRLEMGIGSDLSCRGLDFPLKETGDH